MAQGKAHKNETKAAVIAALMAGQQPSQVCREFGLPESTVRTWGKNAGVDFAEIRAEKKEALADLIAGVLTENLKTLAAQAVHARKPEWMNKQSADSLAVFYGVVADKTIRILEAAAAAQPLEDQTNES